MAKMSSAEVDKFRADHKMTIYGRDIPKPVMNFEQSSFPDYLLAELKNAGFTKPTPIQCQGWPMVLLAPSLYLSPSLLRCLLPFLT